MDAWTVYWLFQLDSIKLIFISASVFASIILIIGCAISGICAGVAKDYMDLESSKKEMAMVSNFTKMLPKILGMFLLVSIMATFIPSTKTMAAIIVLPKIASADNLNTVSKDAGDIYELAMKRLKDALGE